MTKLPMNAALRRWLGMALMWGGLLTVNSFSSWHLPPTTALVLSAGSALLLPLGLALWLSGRAPAPTTGGRVLRRAWVTLGVVLALSMIYYRYQIYQAELVIQAYRTSAISR